MAIVHLAGVTGPASDGAADGVAAAARPATARTNVAHSASRKTKKTVRRFMEPLSPAAPGAATVQAGRIPRPPRGAAAVASMLLRRRAEVKRGSDRHGSRDRCGQAPVELSDGALKRDGR